MAEELKAAPPPGNTEARFTMDKETLYATLRKVSSSVGSVATQGILSNCLLDVGESCAVVTTNLEIGTVCRAKAVRVHTPGTALLPFKLLEQAVGALGDTIEINIKGPSATIISDGSKISLPTADPDLFPKVPIVGSAKVVSAKAFEESLARVLPAASFDEARPALSQVHLSPTGMVASDGSRVHFSVLRSTLASLDIPSTAAKSILTLLGMGAAEHIQIEETDTHVLFGIGDDDFSSRKMEAPFPPIEEAMLVPRLTECKIPMVVSKDRLVSALSRASVIVGRSGVIQMDATKDKITIQAVGQVMGGATTTVETSYKGPDRSSSFKIQNILDALDTTGDEMVTLMWSPSRAEGAFVVKSAQSVAVVMSRTRD